MRDMDDGLFAPADEFSARAYGFKSTEEPFDIDMFMETFDGSYDEFHAMDLTP